MNDSALRSELVALLDGGQAHVALDKTVDGIKPENRTKNAIVGERSIWEVLEHIRLAQHDILQYTLDPNWKSPEWPSGYWPELPSKLSEAAWDRTLSGLRHDLRQLIGLAQNNDIDLTSEIPHSEGHTYLRELLLTADHNAYHLGQVVAMRKALGDWPD